MPKRQIVLIRKAEDGSLESLGSSDGVAKSLGCFNCHTDGSGPNGYGKTPGMMTLYGPGMVLEMPSDLDDVTQVMVTMLDQDFAFPVMLRLCRTLEWLMMDPESGRTLG